MSLFELPIDVIEDNSLHMTADACEALKKVLEQNDGQVVRMRIAGFG